MDVNKNNLARKPGNGGTPATENKNKLRIHANTGLLLYKFAKVVK
jgi:hypothetical protein